MMSIATTLTLSYVGTALPHAARTVAPQTARPLSSFARHQGVSAATRLAGKPITSLRLSEATAGHWEQVVEALAPFTRANRLERLSEVLSKRRSGVHLVLENVADPYNVAAILRTAEGLGVQYVHSIESVNTLHTDPNRRGSSSGGKSVPGPSTKAFTKRAVSNVAMGASRWLTFTRYSSAFDCYAALKEKDVQIVASDCPPCEADSAGDEEEPVAAARRSRGAAAAENNEVSDEPPEFNAIPIHDIDFGASEGGVALVFGNERRGVSKAAVQHADGAFFLPMSGLTQSFNISVAVAMSLYAVIASGRFPEGSLSEAQRLELLGRWLMRDIKAARPLLLREAKIEFTDF